MQLSYTKQLVCRDIINPPYFALGNILQIKSTVIYEYKCGRLKALHIYDNAALFSV